MFRSAAFAAVIAAAMAQPSPQPSPLASCVVSSMGATYDLTSLSVEGGAQIIDSGANDDASGGDAGFTYYVRICNDMAPPTPQCNATTGADGVVRSGPAPIFQVCTDSTKCNNECYRLGDTAANQQLIPFSRNPSHGVSVLYQNGDACSTPSGMRNRAMSLNFICTDVSGFLPQQDLILEDITCRYSAFIYSRAGCPQQCPFAVAPGRFGAGHLCAGQGICDYDWSASAARCFCDKGWSGNDCTQAGDAGLPTPPSFGGNIAGGFFGGIALGAAVLLVGVYVRALMTRNTFADSLNFFGPAPQRPGGSYMPAAGGEGAAPGAAVFTGAGSYAPPASEGGVNAVNDAPLLA